MRKREKIRPKRVWFFKSYYGGRDLFRGKVCFSCLFQKRRGETKGSSHFGEVSAFLLCFFILFFIFLSPQPKVLFLMWMDEICICILRCLFNEVFSKMMAVFSSFFECELYDD